MITSKTSETSVLVLTYILYVLLITAPIGFFISFYKTMYFRNKEKRGHFLDEEMKLASSHYEWLSQTFVLTLLMGMTAIGTAFYFIGYLVGVFAIGYWLIRLGRGVMRLIEHKATPILV